MKDIKFWKNFPKNFNLKGIKIILDCANGVGYKAAPKLLKDLEQVFTLGVKPNGLNINDKWINLSLKLKNC